MTETPTLTDFLLARIAEDEAQAREAIAKRDAIDYIYPPELPDMAFESFEDVGVPGILVGGERALADCEAKRRIVDLHSGDNDPSDCTPWGRRTDEPCDTLLALASVYADRPDFRDAPRARCVIHPYGIGAILPRPGACGCHNTRVEWCYDTKR